MGYKYDPLKNRQMTGEELQGLDIEELQQLERSLEAGLGCVIKKKVCIYHLVFVWFEILFFLGKEIVNVNHFSGLICAIYQFTIP